MTVRVSEVIRGWLGWCPNTPVMRTAPAVLATLPEMMHPSPPGGGAGGSGWINRGFGVALLGSKTLARNMQLLWFPLLNGVVMAFLFITQYVLHLLGTYPYDAIDVPRWLVLTFAAELIAVFSFSVLLAGLVLSLSPEEGSFVSFHEGLSRTKVYLRPLADLSVIVALAATTIYALVTEFGYLKISMILYPVFNQFPFSFIILPEVYHIGPIGGTFAMEYGVTNTLILSGITLLLFVLTLFVVPLLVLENTSLAEAVAGSVSMVKKVLGEVIACFLILGGVVFAVALTSLLFGIVYNLVAPHMLLFWYPGDAWIAAGVLYMLALCGFVAVISTVAGIAMVNLYTYGKTGRLPVVAEGDQVIA
jgi:hypothetical protein